MGKNKPRPRRKKRPGQGAPCQQTPPVKKSTPQTIDEKKDSLQEPSFWRLKRVWAGVISVLSTVLLPVGYYQLRPKVRCEIGAPIHGRDAIREFIITNEGFFSAYNIRWKMTLDSAVSMNNVLEAETVIDGGRTIKRLREDERSVEGIALSFGYGGPQGQMKRAKAHVDLSYTLTPWEKWRRTTLWPFQGRRVSPTEFKWESSQKSTQDFETRRSSAPR